MMAQPRHFSADERRAAMVETVVDLAAEQNPNDITTGAIAQRMGVTQGTLFRHFPSKDTMLQAVMNWIAERLLARVDAAAAGAHTPMAALQAIFVAHIDFIARHPGVSRMVFGELQRPADTLAKVIAKNLTHQYEARLRRLLESGKARGEFDAHLDVQAASIQFIGMIQGLVIQSLLAGAPSRMHPHAAGVFALYARSIRRTA